jgi:hypothetical protein
MQGGRWVRRGSSIVILDFDSRGDGPLSDTRHRMRQGTRFESEAQVQAPGPPDSGIDLARARALGLADAPREVGEAWTALGDGAEPQQGAGLGGEPGADVPARPRRDPPADRPTGSRQRLPGHVLELLGQCPAGVRAQELAGRRGGPAQQAAEELLELLLVLDLEELAGELHLLDFVERLPGLEADAS